MKKTMMVLSVAMMMSSLVFAQKKDRHPNGQRADGLEKLKTELSLDDKQYATIKGINRKYADQFSQVRKDTVTAKKEKHIQLKALHEKRQTEINATLNSEQKTKFETLKKERAEKRKASIVARGEKRQATLIKDLSLTDDQATKLKSANKAFLEKAKALRSGPDKEANKAELKKLRNDHETEIKSILTPDQFSKWKEMRKSAKGKHERKKDKK